MKFGVPLPDEEWMGMIRGAYEGGVRTFITADVYGNGEADVLLSKALSDVKRNSYCLVGAIGHDFYSGQRDGAKGYPRFTHPQLRSPTDYLSYLRMATEKSLERCRTDRFDLLLLHNPDSIGYGSDAVWKAMDHLREEKLAERIGIAPGQREKIFGLFQRLHHMDEYPGTGVGLAIVKKAVERMHGTVGVESEPGKGSRFWVELPKVEK